jgi:hypothetical protein
MVRNVYCVASCFGLALIAMVVSTAPEAMAQAARLPFEGRWSFTDRPSGTKGIMVLRARSAVSGSETCKFHRVTQRGRTYLIDETCDGERLSSSIRVDRPDRLSIRYRVISSGETGTRSLRRLPE